jgi:thymidylate synthase
MKIINKLKKQILLEGSLVDVQEWQSTKIKQKMVELNNLYFSFDCPYYTNDLAALTKADIPWAENHFQERVGGKALNPGKQWENWPFYQREKDDKRFRNNNGDLFDHTYMERFWSPKDLKGIRYNFGDYHDIINRLNKNPYNRQSYLSIWHPEDQSNDKTNKRVPCTLGYFFQIRNGIIDMTYHIRSCDIIRHLKNDLYMSGRLLQRTSQLLNCAPQPGKVYVWIGNLHCFESDLHYLKKECQEY